MTTDTLMATYSRLPVTFERGEGAWIWDTSGKKYLDAFSGVAVCNLGHAHPAVTEALCKQASQLVHTSNWYGITNQQKLADELMRLSGMDKAFFSNSGAEANEAAIKIARLFGHKQDIENPIIIVTDHSFHGRTLATLTATGSRKVQAGFEPLVKGFLRAPYDDLNAITHIAKTTHGVVAVLVEPIQGEGGVNVPGDDYLSGLRSICDENGWLLMLDEIQTGMCRTGKWFAFQHESISPDVITLAKGLANGVPIGACLARGEAAEVLQPGTHGSTFGGNPLACSAALATIKSLEDADLATRAAHTGEKMKVELQQALKDVKAVKDIRGKGLLIGIELDRPCKELMLKALEQGLLINVTRDKVVRLAPPLIIDDEQRKEIVNKVAALINDFASKD
jgi:acetylornithine/N-succinyldiaminopimelate aminotransferase